MTASHATDRCPTHPAYEADYCPRCGTATVIPTGARYHVTITLRPAQVHELLVTTLEQYRSRGNVCEMLHVEEDRWGLHTTFMVAGREAANRLHATACEAAWATR